MSGFGIREQYEVGQILAGQRLWRDTSFMHQLSMNGSLLMNPNHDRMWMEILTEQLGSQGRGWTWHSQLFQALPAWLVRAILYQASATWVRAQGLAIGEIFTEASRHGLADSQVINDYEQRLIVVSQQLDDLQWCSRDDDDEMITAIYA